eukprot:m.898160 g.898160  ORF g.898160 m.898160 type:complete len:61 (-) comp23671_c1_seq2:878-1060(-)
MQTGLMKNSTRISMPEYVIPCGVGMYRELTSILKFLQMGCAWLPSDALDMVLRCANQIRI